MNVSINMTTTILIIFPVRVVLGSVFDASGSSQSYTYLVRNTRYVRALV